MRTVLKTEASSAAEVAAHTRMAVRIRLPAGLVVAAPISLTTVRFTAPAAEPATAETCLIPVRRMTPPNKAFAADCVFTAMRPAVALALAPTAFQPLPAVRVKAPARVAIELAMVRVTVRVSDPAS